MDNYYCDALFDHEKLVKITNTVGSQISIDYRNNQFHCLVVTGISGIVLGSTISFKYNIPLVIVRKGEATHSDNTVEGLKSWYTEFAFLDDFISGGSTFLRVAAEINVVKVYLWKQSFSTGATNIKEIISILPRIPCKIWHSDLWRDYHEIYTGNNYR